MKKKCKIHGRFEWFWSELGGSKCSKHFQYLGTYWKFDLSWYYYAWHELFFNNNKVCPLIHFHTLPRAGGDYHINEKIKQSYAYESLKGYTYYVQQREIVFRLR